VWPKEDESGLHHEQAQRLSLIHRPRSQATPLQAIVADLRERGLGGVVEGGSPLAR